jgi:hypothetical protein
VLHKTASGGARSARWKPSASRPARLVTLAESECKLGGTRPSQRNQATVTPDLHPYSGNRTGSERVLKAGDSPGCYTKPGLAHARPSVNPVILSNSSGLPLGALCASAVKSSTVPQTPDLHPDWYV